MAGVAETVSSIDARLLKLAELEENIKSLPDYNEERRGKELNEKWRDRKFCVLLYPDDPTHCAALEKIRSEYDYLCILHDKDTVTVDSGDNEHDSKKAHWHVIVKGFKNAKWASAFADDVGINVRFVRPCRRFDAAACYLIHLHDKTKYQYDFHDVEGTMYDEFLKAISQTPDQNEVATSLLNYIRCFDGVLSMDEFSLYCSLNHLWGFYRQASSIYNRMIDKHNEDYVFGQIFDFINGFTDDTLSYGRLLSFVRINGWSIYFRSYSSMFNGFLGEHNARILLEQKRREEEYAREEYIAKKNIEYEKKKGADLESNCHKRIFQAQLDYAADKISLDDMKKIIDDGNFELQKIRNEFENKK